MTTVAVRDGVLAFDGRVTADGTIVSDSFKKGICKNGKLIGCAGNAAYITAFLEWAVNGGEVPKNHDGKTENICGIVIDQKGRVTEYTEGMLPCDLGKKEFYAVGSGWHFAMGAMAAGASAIEAVKIAARFDTNTGGRIRSVEFK